jgi:hypothetical protein
VSGGGKSREIGRTSRAKLVKDAISSGNMLTWTPTWMPKFPDMQTQKLL